MSIQQVQTRNFLELIAQSFFVNGINPQSNDIYSHLAQFFSKHPAGLPLVIDNNVFRGDVKSNPEVMNDFFASMIVNLDTLYETCSDHIDQIIMLNTILRTHLERLRIKRKVLEHKVDDYLLGIYNSDGYFYSFSDSFADISFVDLSLSNVFIDTLSTTVNLPSISSLSKAVTPDKIGDPWVRVVDSSGKILSHTKKAPFSNAVDGMTNTAWFFEVKTTSSGPITANVEIQLSTSLGDTRITRAELTPFGAAPVQCGINAFFLSEDGSTFLKPFSNEVKTTADKMSFIGDQISHNIDRLLIQLTKHEPDYIENTDNSRLNVYLFGFKEILLTEHYYDQMATMVTLPFGIPFELAGEAAIDAVSLVVEDYVPTDTSISYFIAADNPEPNGISSFDWRPIIPISQSETAANIIYFDGSFPSSVMVRKTPRMQSDLKLIDLNNTSPDLTKRNPTPTYIPGVDVYRITGFKDEFLAGSIKIEEGINTTRVFYTEYDENALADGFVFWRDKFDTPGSFLVTYGEMDSGHEFLYGADIGEDAKSVYVETFIETDREYPIFLKECRKSDFNSKLWAIRVFLNGKEIANMPIGTDKLTIPWKLKEGVNHIVAMADIPAATVVNPSPYIGTFNIMVGANLADFGVVKLDNWTYVDLYKFQNNQVNEPNSFTIFNGEIISRKKPTDNLKLSYKKQTANAPASIRLRADLSRSPQYAKATPVLDSYRIRFAYSQ